ncbi:Inorganic triphosphatase [Methylobacterium tardum]|uniref:CYTH domain-containing protein n=1 Tax=Methylobacterium tardum TaxID=374432 RepID=A0AA37TMY0_9HYPH|nr:CYTH domain-containing protein [Methylobacterium tardum]URD35155.1 CYTH domain-containing protein [Methylobacterium tardum]GJE52434.1 Inorganic triphosphatase [Methylobacterium tardum]GLS73849.1 CYTH domain-containing protein [Methylobacterium tardum]
MALEIERKFLATPAVLPLCRSGTLLVQGYLYTDAHNTLRVRRAGDRAFLTWKGAKSGATREEVECEVPLQMGEELLADVSPNERIEKMRYRVEHAGAVWDVDVFKGALDGLILAEIEMAHEDELVVLPFWLGSEVTSDQRYRNSRLAAGDISIMLAA